MVQTFGSYDYDDKDDIASKAAPRGYTASASETAPLSTMASALFFGSILFASVALQSDAATFGGRWGNTAKGEALKAAARNARSAALDVRNLCSTFSLLHHVSVFGLILFYAYLCEYHPPHPHAPKSYDRDEFFFLTALLIVAACFTLKPNDPKRAERDLQMQSSQSSQSQSQPSLANGSTHSSALTNPDGTVRPIEAVNEATEVLNRDQTEEWKGWMQFMFLLYHYHHAEEVYNSIRVMITCYVWMTGFGNFSFFYVKGDYSAIRVVQMLWRLNFLVVFLCLTQGTTYILYYICLLHTYFFLMVYVAMRVYRSHNYTPWGARIKMAVLALIIYVVWDLDSGIFRAVHWPFLGETPMLGATAGAMWEWYFRSSLDHWSTFLGMTFALNFPVTSLWYRKLEAMPLWKHVLAKAVVGVAFASAAIWWVRNPFMKGKLEYNRTNAYFAWIPLYAYIYFRNLTPWLRNHTLDLLHQIGKTTLETYLMQHHIWLTSDAKSLLTLIPGWPKMNFLVVTIIYFFLSRRLYQLTLYLRGMVLPNNWAACVRNLIGLAVAIAACFAVVWVLDLVGILSLFTVGAFAIVFGIGLYRAVLALSSGQGNVIDDASQQEKGNGGNGSNGAPIVKRLVSPALGAAALFACGAIWHHAAKFGAAKIKPLPGHCAAYVNKGSWESIDSCNEAMMGELYRRDGIGSLGTCAPQTEIYTWGWDKEPPASLCRFQPKPPASLLKMLNQRKVVFVGDSIIRHIYHGMCRQLGDTGAGAYNTTLEKWADFSRQYKNTGIDFKWAPFTEDLISGVKNVTRDLATEKPDLVIFGGGAWDRLHNYKTEADWDTQTKAVQNLATELKALREKGVPLVWVVPTTINSWALMTEEKRAHITEEEMSKVRDNYKKQGIYESVNFVLDGPAFTRDRVAESYDGVHYPLQVYDAGAQILTNAMDWLISGDPIVDPFRPPHPGSMANPMLGLFVLGCAFCAIFFMDGFLGLSYLAGIFVPSVRPMNLFDEAFGTLHRKIGLPPISLRRSPPSPMQVVSHSRSDDALGDVHHQTEIPVRRKSKNSEQMQDSLNEMEKLLDDEDDEDQGSKH